MAAAESVATSAVPRILPNATRIPARTPEPEGNARMVPVVFGIETAIMEAAE